MASFTLYAIAVVDINDSNKMYRVFDGYDYVTDVSKTAFISDKLTALKEASGRQRLNEIHEVKLFPVTVELPFTLSSENVSVTEATTTNEASSDTLT